MAEAMVKLGAAILPLIETVLPKLVTAVTDLVTWFTNLPTPVQNGILVFLGLFAALGPVLLVIGSLITVAGTLIAVFTAAIPVVLAVGAAVLALGAPLLIIIAVVALLAIAIFTHWNQIIDWTSDLMLKVADTWNKGWQAVSNFFGTIWGDIKTSFQSGCKLHREYSQRLC